jgi:STE24 endopeptidase
VRDPTLALLHAWGRAPPLNAYAAVILAGLLLQLGLELAADVLNLRALGPELSAELRGVYDAERYRRAQEYTRARTRFGMVTAVLDLAVLLAFWFTGGFGALDGWLARLHLGQIATGVLFVGALAIGWALVHVPFRWWSTFVIEERFGFNRTTPRTFWTDLAKGLVLGALLGGPLVAAVLWLFEAAGSRAWLWCWLVRSSSWSPCSSWRRPGSCRSSTASSRSARGACGTPSSPTPARSAFRSRACS